MNETQTFTTFLQDSENYKTIPIVQRFFVDTLTPIQIFQNVSEDACYLLESKDEASPWSRYSFIGLHPFRYIEESESSFVIKDRYKEVIGSEKTFKETFHALMSDLNIKKLSIGLPFWGGGVGFIGYDAVSTIENIKLPQNDDLNMKRYMFMFCETIIAFDHDKKELLIIQLARLTGNEDKQKKRHKYDSALETIEKLAGKILKTDMKTEMLTSLDLDLNVSFDQVTSNYEKQGFIEDVQKIKEYIRNGDIFQAVLSQRFEKKVDVSGFELYRVLRMVNPSPYLFYVKADDIEIIGSSPERLIQIQDGHLEIHPIAGTRRRGKDSLDDERLAQDLLQDEKEHAEHFMLVDLARNDIGRVAEYGSVKTPVLMELGKFSHVMHLISKVTGRLAKNIDPIEALIASFPAGTVSGAPKIRAMQILGELEPTARNVYAGTVAYLGFDGNIDSCIAIRTMVVKNKTVYVQAGAGIVADSKPELEWKETRNKASALIKAIDIAEKLFANKEKIQN